MPLNNSINKNSDTFFATSNITANFTSPVLTTVVTGTTVTNAMTVVFDNPSNPGQRSVLTSEFYSSTSFFNAAPGNRISFTRYGGTKAAPANTSNKWINGQFVFDFLSGVMRNSSAITSYNVNDSATGGYVSFIQTTSANSGRGINFQVDPGNIFLNGSIISSPNMGFVLGDTPVAPWSLSITKSAVTAIGRYISINNNDTLSGFSAGVANNTSVNGAGVYLLRARGTPTALTDVATNDVLGSINFAGRSNTANVLGAYIQGVVDNTIGVGILPTRLEFFTANSSGTLVEALQIDSAQRVTQPLQPSFSASLSADVANATGDGTAYTVAFDTEQYDQGANFAANTFTAPIAGRYRFNWTISIDDLLVGHTKMEVTVGGQTVCRVNPYAIADSDGFCLLNGSVDLSLAASATVTMVVTVSGSTKTVTVKGTTTSGTFLSGQLQV